MITNEKQYRHARALLARFEQQWRRAQASDPAKGVHPDVHRAMVAGLSEQVSNLRGQISEYERVREGQKPIEVKTLAELPTALIKARIARGWTQRQLAENLGLKEQQVQRYEMQRYKGVAFERMHDVAMVLGIEVSVRFDLVEAASGLTEKQVAAWRRASVALLVESFRQATGKPIRGRLKLQKLLLLWNEEAAQRLGSLVFGHKPLHYGAYDDELNNDIEIMRSAGMLSGKSAAAITNDPLKNEDDLLSRVVTRTRAHRRDEVYELTRAGLTWLRTFVGSDELLDHRAKEELVQLARGLADRNRQDDSDSLIELTYERFPILAEKSKIRPKVVARLRRRAGRG